MPGPQLVSRDVNEWGLWGATWRGPQPAYRLGHGEEPGRCEDLSYLSGLQGAAEKHILTMVKITVGIALLLKTK